MLILASTFRLFIALVDFTSDVSDKKGYAQTLDYLADCRLDNQDFDQALTYAKKALLIGKNLNNERLISSIMREIGSIYRQSGQEKKALTYYNNSLKIRNRLQDEWGISDCLHSISLIHLNRGQYKRAIAYQQKALTTSERLGDLAGMVIHFQTISAKSPHLT